MNSKLVLDLAREHPDKEQLLLLTALSMAWLNPANVNARELVERYREAQYPFDALRETVLQLFLVAGFQVSLEAAFQIEAVYGHGLSSTGRSVVTGSVREWYERGRELQSAVYRGNVEKLRVNLERVSPELAHWTVLIGYGMVMSRPGLYPHWRELLEVSILAVQGFSRQLHSHLRGALNMGAAPDEIDLVMRLVEAFCSPERHAHALRMWQMIRSQYCHNGR